MDLLKKEATGKITMLVFFSLIGLLLLAKAGKLLIPIFPLGSLGVGLFLYRYHPAWYIGFTWWLWLIAPFIRRMIDHQSGYFTPGPWNLVPILVTGISLITLVKNLPKSLKLEKLGFIISCFCVLYGFLVRLIYEATFTDQEILILLSWLSPIAFGFHVAFNWQHYPRYRQVVLQTFLWGILLAGLYGIWQFLAAPIWDMTWLEQACPCFGFPEAMEFRVFSTMYTPQTFAAMAMAGIIVLLSGQGWIRFLAIGAGFTALMLSTARSAWLSFALSLIIFIGSLNLSKQLRFILSISFCILLTIPLLTTEPFGSMVGVRIATFFNLTHDHSFNSRFYGSMELLGPAMTQFLGQGLNTDLPMNASIVGHDSGFFYSIYSLGLIGFLPYLMGLFLLIVNLLFKFNFPKDIFIYTTRSIAIGTLIGQIGLNNIMEADLAIPVWFFIGISLAGKKYHLSNDNFIYLRSKN